MKRTKPFFRAVMSIAVLAMVLLITGMPVSAQTEKVLHAFLGGSAGLSDPISGVTFDAAGNLYGIASSGGAHGVGGVYKLAPTASGWWTETLLHSFGGTNDGQYPSGNLVMDASGNLYGTTLYGGTGGCAYFDYPPGCGTVFELAATADGQWHESVIYSFQDNGTDGFAPGAGVILDSSGNIYGTTAFGGANGSFYLGGIAFELVRGSDNTWTEQILHTFGNGSSGPGDDGSIPSGLTFDKAGNLYGTTTQGGATSGTVFELTPGSSGWTESVLHNFSGDSPAGSLIFDSSGNIYGASAFGGAYTWGSVYELSLSGGGSWNYSLLFSFSKPENRGGKGPYEPDSGVVFGPSGSLYGTTKFGGSGDGGTVYELTPASGGGWTEKIVRNFGENNPDYGYYPGGGVVFDSAGNLYGTTPAGGAGNSSGGVVYEIIP